MSRRPARLPSLFLALFACAFPPVFHAAEGLTDSKVRLMNEVFAARDRGDLRAAEERLRALEALVPGDREVARLRADIESRLAADGNRSPAVSSPAVSAAPPPNAVEPRSAPVMPRIPTEAAPTVPTAELGAVEEAAQRLLRGGEARISLIADYIAAKRALARRLAENGDYRAAIDSIEDSLRELDATRKEMVAEKADFQRQQRKSLLDAQSQKAGLRRKK